MIEAVIPAEPGLTVTRFTDRERRSTFAGVLIIFLLSALDQTIVSTAMPRIVAELDGLALYAWVTTAYLLTSTVLLPIWGKLSDSHGRKPVLLAAIAIFLVGSALSGLSGEFGRLPLLGDGMTQLILFRAVQGIGGGGLFTIAFTIVSDLYSAEERARLGGVMGAIFGLSSAVGPFIGGFLTDHGSVTMFGHAIAGWRWVFYVNLPLGALSLALIIARMPRIRPVAVARIDYPGALLVVGTVVPLLLALTWGGETLPWTAPTILALFGASLAALLTYIVAERFAADPILPLALFRDRVFTTTNLAGFLISMGFISTVAFLPLFMQLAQGASATASGLSVLPLMAGIMASSVAAGQLAARIGRYRSIILASIALTAVGIWLLSRMTADTSQLDLVWRVALLGVGLGPSQSLFTLAVQERAAPGQMGVVTSASQFFKQIGATMGVALFGTVLGGYLKAGVGKVAPGLDLDRLRGAGAAIGAGGGAPLPPMLREAIAGAVTQTFLLGMVVLVAAFLVTLLMPDLAMAKARPDGDGALAPDAIAIADRI